MRASRGRRLTAAPFLRRPPRLFPASALLCALWNISHAQGGAPNPKYVVEKPVKRLALVIANWDYPAGRLDGTDNDQKLLADQLKALNAGELGVLQLDGRYLLVHRQNKHEFGPFIFAANRRNDAPVALHNLFADRESDPSTGILALQPSKDLEDLFRVLRIKPDTVIANGQDRVAAARRQ